MGILSKIRNAVNQLQRLEQHNHLIREALGRIEARQLADRQPTAFSDAEFKVFSQHGEDGLIERLVSRVAVPRKLFVEFGVENYEEANTRFLLRHRNWSGLVIDGSIKNVESIRRQDLYWRHTLTAVAAFVTRDNINQLLCENGAEGEIGLLSIDIDGNDYWVWEAISVVQPSIVVIEYNARFGPHAAVTIPYDPSFARARAHHSMIYYGASLRALWLLGRRKGYDLVGCNSAGNNAFFVVSERRPAQLPALLPENAWRPTQFREARRPDGSLAFLDADGESGLLQGLPLVDVEKL